MNNWPPPLLRVLEQWSDCERCEHVLPHREHIVFGEGEAPAPLLVIGEPPGKDENAVGRPFMGRAGRELRRLFEEVGVDWSKVFLAPLIACHPPQNRVPMPDEVEACSARIDAILRFVAPKVVLLVGGTAATALAGIRHGITKDRGRWQEIEWSWRGLPQKTTAMPTLNPAGFLRSHDESARDAFAQDVYAAAKLAGALIEGAGHPANSP